MAKLTRDILVLSSGLARKKGASIGQGEVPDIVWQNWIKEGIVIVDSPPDPPAPLEIEPEVSPSPHDGDTQSSEGDAQLQTLTDDQLRLMAKQLHIQAWHRMSRGKLLERIEEHV